MKQEAPPSRRRPKLLLLVAALAVVVVGLLAYSRFLHARNDLLLSRRHLRNAQSLLGTYPSSLLQVDYLTAVGREFDNADRKLASARRNAWPAAQAGSLLGWLPGVGPDLAAAPHGLRAASGVARIGSLSVKALLPLAQLASTSPIVLFPQDGFSPELMRALQQGQPHFALAEDELRMVLREREAIDEADLSAPMAEQIARLDAILPLLETAIRTGAAAPELAISLFGLNEPKTYLIVAQNSDELRATGGFIGGVWLLRMNHGRVEQLEFQDSALVDDPTREYGPPPEGLFKYLNAGIWQFRDANWNPDFPTSAKNIARFYEVGQGIKVDGVIAIDQAGLQKLLTAAGPVFLKEFAESVSGENVVAKVKDYYTAANREENPLLAETALIPARKRFMNDLLEALVASFQDRSDSARTTRLVRALNSAFQEKHLFVYLGDPQIAAVMSANGWDGSLPPVKQDYLMVIDSNVGFDKINPQIAQSLDYQIVIMDDAVRAKVMITYRNNSTERVVECVQQSRHAPAYPQYQEGCYWDYLRVYAPKGSKLFQATYIPLPQGSLLARVARQPESKGPVVEPTQGDKQVFSNFFSLAPGETKQVSFEYQLPPFSSEDASYRLLVQKQAGTDALPLQVQVTLPKGARLKTATPTPASTSASTVIFKTDLRADREFIMRYEK